MMVIIMVMMMIMMMMICVMYMILCKAILIYLYSVFDTDSIDVNLPLCCVYAKM